jgi:hypothetical protein
VSIIVIHAFEGDDVFCGGDFVVEGFEVGHHLRKWVLMGV